MQLRVTFAHRARLLEHRNGGGLRVAHSVAQRRVLEAVERVQVDGRLVADEELEHRDALVGRSQMQRGPPVVVVGQQVDPVARQDPDRLQVPARRRLAQLPRVVAPAHLQPRPVLAQQ
eukprot:697374-Rhodomonas_salina.1